MNTKAKLLKAAAICSYVFTALWFVVAACFFALSNNLYWMFAVFALITLYDGFVIMSIRDNMNSAEFNEKQNITLLVCGILCVLSPVSLVLCEIAYLGKFEDKNVSDKIATATTAETTAETTKKAFFRKPSFIVMCCALVAIFLFSFAAMCFETSGFSVSVSDFTLTREMTLSYNEGKIHGKQYVIGEETDVDGNVSIGSYAVTMYVPNTATEENPAPVVFVLPGFTRTKATMAQYCIELSRRGAVVFTLDPGAQGSTTANSTAGANGVEYLVQYVYNNSDDFKFCDKNRFGAIGHSAGGGNVITLASDMAGDSYQNSIIKAVYNSGYIKISAANKFAKLNCNAAMSYAYYDEGAFRYQTDTTAVEVISKRFINEVAGSAEKYDTVEWDKDYGDMTNGTYRVVHRELINHCFEMYDALSIANTIDFFNRSLAMGSGLSNDSQIWFGKEFFNGLSLAAAFTFILALCGVLMNTPFFATLKNGGKAKAAESAEAEVAAVQTEVQPLVTPVSNSIAHKVILWSTMILTAIIACLDYIPLANLSIEVFPVSNLASVFTYVFPARMINAILLWALINGAIGLVIFFATTALENLYEYIVFKAKGTTPHYDWSKFEAIKIRGNGWKNVLFNVLKTLLLPVIFFGSFYFLVQLTYWCFHQDFRFMLVSAAPLNARMFVTMLEYAPIIFVFYISNSIRVNCSIGREGWKEWKVMLVGALANSLGLAFILLINYVCYFVTGTPYYGYWGNNNEVWLFVNMVFGLVVMMFLLPIFNRIFYKQTGNVWVGAITCCLIFIMMTISASVSYIPLY
uniref:poly(ethylene terephthalate) hydrolase family protein n=1 Tax=Candidatus Fimenecus sp. TaxID=3022888 RepID=UPI004026AA5A